MPKFNYTAMDAKGKEVNGSIDAESVQAAIGRIREMGAFPTNITEAGQDKKNRKSGPQAPTSGAAPKRVSGKKGLGAIEIPFLTRKTIKSKALTAFTRQLATLIDAGLPLLRGLHVLQKQEADPLLKRTIGSIAEAVEGGSTFSEALAQHPKIFNRLFVNMVRAGEAGGVLDLTLQRLADFQEKAQKIKNKVISAMVYPAVVMFMAMIIMAFLLMYVVPQFRKIFQDLLQGKPLPFLTEWVIGASNIMKDKFLYVAGAIAAIVIVVQAIGRTTKGRFILDKIKLKTPVFGTLTQKVGIARFSRTLGTLISSGVPILQALNIVKETAGNAVIAGAIGRVHDAVKEGERITQPMEASGVFPSMVVSMVDVGEETGALPDMLMKVSDVYDDEVDNAVGAMTALLEPIMIIFLAIVVGTIVIAMFWPLIEVITSLTAGASG